jgi:hypothetical protein
LKAQSCLVADMLLVYAKCLLILSTETQASNGLISGFACR